MAISVAEPGDATANPAPAVARKHAHAPNSPSIVSHKALAPAAPILPRCRFLALPLELRICSSGEFVCPPGLEVFHFNKIIVSTVNPDSLPRANALGPLLGTSLTPRQDLSFVHEEAVHCDTWLGTSSSTLSWVVTATESAAFLGGSRHFNVNIYFWGNYSSKGIWFCLEKTSAVSNAMMRGRTKPIKGFALNFIGAKRLSWSIVVEFGRLFAACPPKSVGISQCRIDQTGLSREQVKHI